MPTLLNKGSFQFNKNAIISTEQQNWVKSLIAIEIIKNILSQKFSTQNRTYFLQGRTGSGKSTLMVSELYKKFIKGTNYKLICSEPRVVLTKSNALDIIRFDKNFKLGENVGILTGPEKIKCTRRDCLYYCTPQILNDQLLRAILNKNSYKLAYKIIIIDEVHVLDLPMITLLYTIHNYLEIFKNDIKSPMFIFTSATIDMNSMISYFYNDVKSIYLDPLMIGYVAGDSNHAVKSLFIQDNEMIKYISEERQGKNCYKIMAEYYKNNFINIDGDVLFFLPVVSGMRMLAYFIKELIQFPSFIVEKDTKFDSVVQWRNETRNKKRCIIICFARDLSEAGDILLSFPVEPDQEALKFEKKIIISTPVLETGKTISTLTLCIDMGLNTTTVFNPLTFKQLGIENIKQIPENKSQAIQRQGRVGREIPGTFVHFYTENCYNEFLDNDMPATINAYCLSPLLLDNMQLIKLHHKDLDSFTYDFINGSNYIYNISTDILLKSTIDLITAGYYTIWGEVVEYRNSYKNSQVWFLYAQYLFYIKGYSLFESLILILVNLYNLPSILTPTNFNEKNLKISLDYIKELKNNKYIDSSIIDAIVKARNIITKVKYDETYEIFRNLSWKLF